MERDFKFLIEEYGLSGARDKFEDICEILLSAMYSDKNVQKVHAFPGDSGIDVLVGEPRQATIHVFQCKFFTGRIGDSLKAQIRNSFKKAAESSEMFAWTLCLPTILTQK